MKKIRLGAVMSSPIVPEIWWEFGKWTKDHGLELEMVYHDFYKPQINSFLRGEIDITWNGPLGFVATDYFFNKQELIGPMRDTDRDTKSIYITRKNSEINSIQDLKGKKIGFGQSDSAEGRIIPISYLRNEGLEVNQDYTEVNYSSDPDLLFGTFGQSEFKAAQAVLNGEVDASAVWEKMFKGWISTGKIDENDVEVIGETSLYDHCIFVGHPDLDSDLFNKFNELFLAMDANSDQRIAKGMELEKLNKWLPGRVNNFKLLQDGSEYLNIFKNDFNNINF